MAASLTRTKLITNLTPDEYKACYSLNLRYSGLMQETLSQARRGLLSHPAYATLRYNRDGSLAGWSLIFHENWDSKYQNAYFYVRKNQRRTGIGKSLVKHVSQKFGQVRVYPHDSPSNKFFNFVHENKLNIDIAPYYPSY